MSVARKSTKILLSWVGQADIDASEGVEESGLGPIAQAVATREFDQIVLLSNYPMTVSKKFVSWLGSRTDTKIHLRPIKLSSPTDYGETYKAAISAIDDVLKQCGDTVNLTFHLSPGTRAMAAVWILVAKTRHSAELIESSKQQGVKTVNFPFDLSAEFIPTLLRRSDRNLLALSAGEFEAPAQFDSIIHRSPEMQQVLAHATKVALRSIPVLIEGESGTGKEMLAQAIHQYSPRSANPFIAVNCGAIPKELVEAEFFGTVKGAYTGAEDRTGHFENANGGTLFLDEVGELPLLDQVKLLRALQEEKITRVGESKTRKVDVRIIAATNKSLLAETSEGRFRQDLFYRLAVALIRLPPLRERTGDVGLLSDHLLAKINRNLLGDPGWQDKKLSSGARNALLNHEWPGNIRELENTLLRAAVFTLGDRIGEADIRQAMLTLPTKDQSQIMNRDVTQGIDLPSIVGEVATHYLTAALEAANGNMSKAAELVSLPSYQTFKNWLKKYNSP